MSDKILEVSDLQIRYVTDEETVRRGQRRIFHAGAWRKYRPRG